MYKVSKTEYENLTDKEQMIIKHIPLAINIAKKIYVPNEEHDQEDLIQISIIGLIKAVEKYDKDSGNQFSTYAYHSCKGELLRFIRDNHLIKIPRKMTEARSLIHKYRNKGLTDEQIKEIAKEEFNCYIEYRKIKNSNSLDAAFDDSDNNSTSLHEIISDGILFEDKFCLNIELEEAYNSLTEYEKTIIDLKFNENKTQNEIADILKTNQTKINRTLRKTLSKLKNFLNKSIV